MRAKRSPLLRAGLTAFAIAAAFAAGCSTADQLDMDSAMTEIEAELTGRFDVSKPTLSCPDDVEAAKGTEFTCTGADRSGRAFEIDVEVLNSRGQFTYTQPEFERKG